MPDLKFNVMSARAALASGGISLRMSITNTLAEEQVESIALSVQLQIEPARRRYSDVEKMSLNDVFGDPSRWATTVRPIFWTIVKADVPSFSGHKEFDLLVPYEFDSDVAAARYFRALESGDVPVALLFSGRVLYVNGGSLQMSPIPWSLETSSRIPLQVFTELPANSRGVAWT